MMYIAVNNYKKVKDVLGKYIGIFICVMTFILCGFEHSVANMAYFSIANIWNLKVILYLLIMVLGNSVGSILIALFYNRFYKN
ncbi:MAG: formate/nitrite transporter family protein [Bacilli bacterium]|nr:formate/nitrite transporter family protein [Bacilli bacterium]